MLKKRFSNHLGRTGKGGARRARLALVLVLAACAAAAVASWARMAPAPAPARDAVLTAKTLSSAQLFSLPTEPWRDAPEAGWSTGRPPLCLQVVYGTNIVRVGEDGRGQRVRLRSYNGGLVGPTIRVAPNDRLPLLLDNQLPVEAAPQGGAAHAGGMQMAGLNTTNLHTHGLHISPSGLSDDVLREVPPQSPPAPYQFDILPAGNPPGEPSMTHYPGTFWYHAHLHGATAAQLASGMAGALVVSGDIDQIPQIREARERIFVFQQLAFDNDGEVKSLDDINQNWSGDNPGDPPRHGPKKHTSINGVVKPLIQLRPEQVERWRMIDAGIFEQLNLSLRNENNPQDIIPLHEIALDGITLKAVKVLSELQLNPGYRADLLIKAPRQPGRYLMYKSRPAVALTELTLPAQDRLRVDQPEILAVVEVRGEPCTSATNPCASHTLDAGTRLPAPLPDLGPPTGDPVPVTFSIESGQFLINGRVFNPDEVSREFRFVQGTTRDLALASAIGSHPFHIHVNAFQLVNPDGRTVGEWRDTILVESGKPIRVRTRFDRFPGRFVMHCHILTHEDKGMMQLVEVAKPPR